MLILAGDIGGTKTILTLVDSDGRNCETRFEQRFDSQDYAGLEPVVEQFLQRAKPERPIVAACFAIAGPVERTPERQTAKLTNLPWQLDSLTLARGLDIPRVRLVNDFAAIAYGLDQLKIGDLETLQASAPHPEGVRLIAGAGTGLGICSVVRHAGELVVIPSEGGHAGFAPANEEQARLLAWVRDREGRCTREHLLSGGGIRRIFDFLQADAQLAPGQKLAEALAASTDAAAAISAAARDESDPLAVRTLELFADIYAGQLGDLALGYLAHGGVFIAGGIAPKVLPFLQRPEFLAAFNDKAPMTELTRNMPLKVILNEHAGLIGAAHHAASLALQDATMA